MIPTVLRTTARATRVAQRRMSTMANRPFTETVLGNSIIGGGLGLVGALMWKMHSTNTNQSIKEYYNTHKH